MYKVIKQDDLFVVQNPIDDSLVKSQGTVLTFNTEAKAEALQDYLTEQISLIAEANRFWYSREKDEDGHYVLKRFEHE